MKILTIGFSLLLLACSKINPNQVNESEIIGTWLANDEKGSLVVMEIKADHTVLTYAKGQKPGDFTRTWELETFDNQQYIKWTTKDEFGTHLMHFLFRFQTKNRMQLKMEGDGRTHPTKFDENASKGSLVFERETPQ